MAGSWQLPVCCSVIGASHRRLGKPCQDGSLVCSLRDPNGQTLQLMALADGHGGERYWLSDVGSQLACKQAVLAVKEALLGHPLTDQTSWRELLAGALPAAIKADWLKATASHWSQRPEAVDQPFSPVTYGCTLGVVLLAPTWWGHTGLGDWDLVRRSSDGTMDLISEEREACASGEATASLCMAGAAAICANRAALHPLSQDSHPFALLLSTDGVRKSCATDGDFLALGHHLAGLSHAAQLEAALEQITSQGSGDDVSIAIGLWGSLNSRSTPPLPRRPGYCLAGPPLLLGIGAAALGAGLCWLQPWQGWNKAVKPAASPPTSISSEAQQLCASSGAIAAPLLQPQTQFDQILQAEQTPLALFQQKSPDPLAIVIASGLQLSADPSPLTAPALVELNICTHLGSGLVQRRNGEQAPRAKLPVFKTVSWQHLGQPIREAGQ